MVSDDEDEDTPRSSSGPSTSTPKKDPKHPGRLKKSKSTEKADTEGLGQSKGFESAFMIMMKDNLDKGKKVRPFYMYEHNSSFLTVTARALKNCEFCTFSWRRSWRKTRA